MSLERRSDPTVDIKLLGSTILGLHFHPFALPWVGVGIDNFNAKQLAEVCVSVDSKLLLSVNASAVRTQEERCTAALGADQLD